MKILLLSDLHLSAHPLDHPQVDADIAVVAGDVARPEAAIQWAAQLSLPSLFVAGNHEYYGSDPVSTIARLRDAARTTRVNVLECDQWQLGGVRFLGCTLWSDHRLYRDAQERERGLAMAQAVLYDFSRISMGPDDNRNFSPEAAAAICNRSLAWLEERFSQPWDGPTVVLTHFAPSRMSIHPRFADSPINACFVSDLSTQIARWQPDLWLHGHTHNSFDYHMGKTRVVCNPRGYAPAGNIENPEFDPGLVIRLDD